MGQKLQNFFEIYFKELYFPKIQVTDVIEIPSLSVDSVDQTYKGMDAVERDHCFACLHFTRSYL